MLEISKPLPSLPRGQPSLTTTYHRPRSSSRTSPLIPAPTLSFPYKTAALSFFTDFLANAQCLYCLLSYLPWPDFVALSQSCKRSRQLFADEHLRDIILIRYVDGYGYCLRNRDPRLASTTSVPVTLHDLDLLFISLSTPIHVYPTHALSISSAATPSMSHGFKTQRLIRLAQAHSRFVLLIQTLAHSSSQPPAFEPEPDSLFGYASDTKHATSTTLRSQSAPRRHIREITSHAGTHSIRELRFPAPLALSGLQSRQHYADTTKDRTSDTRHSVSSNRTSPSLHSSVAPSSFHMSTASASRTTIKKKNRQSFFGGSSQVPYPRPSEPTHLKYHSWRYTTVQSAPHSRRSSSTRRSAQVSSESWMSEDDSPFAEFGLDEFRRPRPRFTHSDSSLGSQSSSPSVSIASPASTPQSASPSPSPPALLSLRSRNHHLHPASTAVSPHDLVLSTSSVRAPILRVFVPCSQLSEEPAPNSEISTIEQCEQQLLEAGLWQHLSTGDVICNLGYVPGSVGSNSSGNSDDDDEADPPGFIFRRRIARNTPSQSQKWLVFNGEFLVPFSPAEDKIPHDDPLSLPSPWYYDHIIPSYNPDLAFAPVPIILRRLPPFLPQIPQLNLINYATKVKSPTSRGGVAKVKKWVWIARIWRGRGVTIGELTKASPGEPPLEMGVGWEGEWILESDGTKEGRQVILNTIKGTRKHTEHWEFVRERSGGGRIWLRLRNQQINDPARFDTRA